MAGEFRGLTTELHGLELSVETLRHWMIEDGLWIPRARREPRIQQPRRRRPCRGELIQIDGCDHAWFDERAVRCTLLVFIDDATSAPTVLRAGDPPGSCHNRGLSDIRTPLEFLSAGRRPHPHFVRRQEAYVPGDAKINQRGNPFTRTGLSVSQTPRLKRDLLCRAPPR